MDTPPVVTLENLAEGAAAIQWQHVWEQLLANIADENTEPAATRKIIVEVTVKPDEKREMADVEVKVHAKLPGNRGVPTRAFLGKDRGMFVAREYNPQQLALPNAGADNNVTAISPRGDV